MRSTQVVLIVLSCVSAGAQITPVEEKGLPPNSVFSGGDVDAVNLQNGNLHISIPIATIAQRGGEKLQYSFVYDTPAWIKQYEPNQCPNPQLCDPPGMYVAELNPNVSSGWRVSDPLNWGVSFTESGVIACQTTSQEYQQETNWAVFDPQGTRHALPLRYEIASQYSCLGQTTKGPTLDGSGMVYDAQANILYLKNGEEKNVSNFNSFILKQPDNLTFLSRDRNGNLITPNADTLNRSLLAYSNGTNPDGSTYSTYTIENHAGNPLTFRVDFQQMSFQTDICAATAGGAGGAATNCTDSPTAITVPTKLTLPNGKTYVFKYAQGSPGDLQELDLPNGAYITYSYTDFYQASPYQHGTQPNYVGSRAVTKRVETIGSQVNTWTYNPSIVSDKVTDPMGNSQVHQFAPVSINVGPTNYTTTSVYETGVLYYDSSGNLLRTVGKTYTGEPDLVNNAVANVRVISTTTTLENGQTSQVQTDFETFQYPCVDAGGACTGTATRLNPTETREYDYGTGGPGALLRRTDYTYLHTGNQNYIDLNIVDKPTSITVYDGSGNMAAETVNEYDNYSHNGQPMQASNAIQHDSGYGTGFLTRGNLTAVERWRNTDGALLTTTNQFDDAGNALSTIDPGGHQTSYSFTDSWASSACVPSGATAAFPTLMTNAKGQTVSTTYYACNGAVGSTTDLNGETTTNTYDAFDRPLNVSFPDGGSKAFCYSDDPNGSCYNAGSLFSTETDAISGSTSMLTTTLYDALGRTQETQLNSDPDGTDYVDIFYDGDGRAYQKTNPYRSGDTQYTTTTYYDGIGRVSSVSEADGSSTYMTYAGNTTTVTDEAGNSRKSQSDALGRLNYVWEDPAGLNYETDYQYDVLGNLLQVTQKGGDSNSADWRVRSFTFNSLGQLLCSANPEIGSPLAAVASCPTTDNGSYIAGTTRYNYNNDDELISKIAPLSNQQGTSTATVTYTYDALHRSTGTTYSDGTPSVAYTFDNDPVTACTAPSLTATNLVGHIKAMCDSSGATSWSYDPMGRPATESRTIAGVTDQIGYTYYLNGAVDTVTYPLAGGTTPFVVTYHENSGGQIDTATGSDGVTYAQVSSTFASGMPNVWQLGSNIQLTDTYNARLQPLSTTAEQLSTTNTLFSRTYNFHAGTGDNGNLYGVQDGLDGLSLNRPNGSVNYGYDTLNRLMSAGTTGTDCTMMSGGTHDWASNYSVDAWGNLTAKTSILCQGEAMSASTTNNRNQLSSASYDAAGDVIQENGVGYTYDAEGRLINGSGTAYTYDGMGERVVKGGSKLYWKGVGSTALTETNQQGASLSRYIFFNGQRIAREDANPGCGSGFTPPRYYVTDNVGSTALVTDSIGDVLNESLFFPYGVERIISQNDTGNNYKFSGKERDPETGLDDFGARYYESALGRFMTPDWDAKPITVPYAKFGDPQTLNLYSYVENGPVNRVDADGHDGAQASISAPQEPVGHCGSAGGDANCLPILASQLMHGGYGLLTFLANVEAESQQAAASTGNNVAPPPPPPASATAQQQSNPAVGNTTVGDLSKVLTNEIGSLSTPKGGDSKELANGSTALANALIDNANKKRPNGVAPDTGTASPSLATAMKDAYTNRANGGADPVQGRTFYGTSHIPPDRLHSRPIGNGRQTVFQHFGPFRDSTSRLPTYIYIYNDPGH
ncbi:RHS repeat-associated core domain-containing protein [Granulicella sp. 5B5]|uniref:RHS repeat domain-containing protein n=1 Tax=Granulicella sp. 5B5 TaxID=1617967 RepID=UPI001C70FFE1|nr:RHS repeat-associated core domain-containing protein [Granulicella sp. 5B5]